jgi:hypothetical protein
MRSKASTTRFVASLLSTNHRSDTSLINATTHSGLGSASGGSFNLLFGVCCTFARGGIAAAASAADVILTTVAVLVQLFRRDEIFGFIQTTRAQAELFVLRRVEWMKKM